MTAVQSPPRYRRDRLIATGGMGEVWAATMKDPAKAGSRTSPGSQARAARGSS